MANSSVKPPFWFWIISIVALLWHLIGINAYLQQAYRTESFTSMLNAEQLNAVNNIPAWAVAAFAIAVFFGALGSIALLLRKNWAKPLFVIAILGLIVQLVHFFFVGNSMELFGPPVIQIMALIVLLIMIWYTKRSYVKGWIS